MKSKLFNLLARLPGINWFNHKNRITYDPVETEKHLVHIAKGGHTYNAIKEQNYRYYEHMMGQAQYIKAMNKLIDEFDFEIEKWDAIQAGHESELERLKDIIRKRDIEIKNLQQRVVLSKVKMDDSHIVALLNALEKLNYDSNSGKKENVRLSKIHQRLSNFLNHLQNVLPKEVKDGDQ